MHDTAAEEYSGHDSKAQYFWVWGALLGLTAIEVVLGYKQIFQPVRMLGGAADFVDHQVGADYWIFHASEI